jgi:hypothetical protein
MARIKDQPVRAVMFRRVNNMMQFGRVDLYLFSPLSVHLSPVSNTFETENNFGSGTWKTRSEERST